MCFVLSVSDLGAWDFRFVVYCSADKVYSNVPKLKTFQQTLKHWSYTFPILSVTMRMLERKHFITHSCKLSEEKDGRL